MNSVNQKNKHHGKQANRRPRDDSSEEAPATDTGPKHQDPTTTKKWKQELFVLKFCIYLLVAAVATLTIITNLSDNHVFTNKIFTNIIVPISALFPVALGLYFAFVTVSKNDLKALTLYDKLVVRLLIFASMWLVSAPAIELARDSPTSFLIVLMFLAMLFLPFYIAYLVIFRRNKHTEATKDKKVAAPSKLRVALAIGLLIAVCWWGYGVALIFILAFLGIWGSGEAWFIILTFLLALYIVDLVISKRNKHKEPTSTKQVVASDKFKMITLTVLGFLIGVFWGTFIAFMFVLSSGE